jgi:limonene-1,2-epoxide hydrolase
MEAQTEFQKKDMATTPLIRPSWAPSTDATASNPQEEAVLSFLGQWKDLDALSIGPVVDKYFTADSSYYNMPSVLTPAHGIEAVKASVTGFFLAFSMSIITLRVASSNGIVMTERIDRLTRNGKTYDLLLMGIFELEGTQIKTWRDYLDLNDVEKAHGISLHG